MNIKATFSSLMIGALACTHISAQEASANAKGITVKVLGSVQLPSIYFLPVGETITDAINMAGGIKGAVGSEQGTGLSRVQVVREGKVIVINVEKIRAHKLKNFTLQDKDTVQVPDLIL